MKQAIRSVSFVLMLAGTLWAGEYDWKATEIGNATPAGTHTWKQDVLTITGAGAGLDVKAIDQCHFVYLAHVAGDFDVTARFADFNGEGAAEAGIMARASNAPDCPMVAFFAQSNDNTLRWKTRLPNSSVQGKPRVMSRGTKLAQKGPVWLRMVRLEKNFAVYKSRDGKTWAMVSNGSGGPVALDGPFELGFFVCSAAEGKSSTASFDSLRIGPPDMGYRTSWVGNTFGCQEDNLHVSNGLAAMWVAPDGTCYTSSYWDEAGAPVTSYRDGKIARTLPIGTPATAEGGITGDDKHIYVATTDRVTVLDPAAPDFAPRPLTFSLNLMDKKANHCAISGMASNGKELFVADWRDNVVRVASVESVKTYHTPRGPNDGVAFAPGPVTVPEGDARFAPAEVYQTQRVGEGVRYTLPNCTPGAAYTIRCHLAEFVKRAANCDPRNRTRTIGREVVNVAELAGGVLKAAVKDFPGYKADEKGNVILDSGSYGGPGLCGFELLDTSGKRVFAVNCGGATVGDFKGETAELVDRAIRFERPGPMAFDRRGELWIIQCGNDFPIGFANTPKYKASVKCYKTDGTFTGREITDVVNPRALGYDAANDMLLVAENGPDLNVRFYGSLDKSPTLAKTFGEKGGIYSGKHPGLVHDPEAGDYARFAGISGVGVDARGNLYIGGGFQGTDLRMFTPQGQFGWMLNSLMFCSTYDVDPDSDGDDIYGTYNHIKLDLSQTQPGKEQTLVSLNWDLRNHGQPVRAGASQAILRRLGPDKRLIMFTSGQGTIGDINIYRYDGEIAIPCGGTRESKSLWIDKNGDGKEDPDELVKMDTPLGWTTALCVDAKGDIWAGIAGNDGCHLRHFFFKGLNERGVPIYGASKGDGYEDVRFPDEGGKISAWAMFCRLDYDVDRDVMVLFFPAVPRKGEKDPSPPQNWLACYENWSKGNRTARWKQPVLEPAINPDYFMNEVGLFPYRGYQGMKIAGDYIFFAYLFGEVHVFDLKSGALVKTLLAGPEVAGGSAWEDAAMGLRAFRRKNGEYLIFTENSGWGGKNNFFRWKP